MLKADKPFLQPGCFLFRCDLHFSIVLSASVGCIKVKTDQYVSDLETVQGIDAKYGKTIHRGITSGGGQDGITPGCRERWELLAEDEMQVDQDVKRKRKGKSATADDIGRFQR